MRGIYEQTEDPAILVKLEQIPPPPPYRSYYDSWFAAFDALMHDRHYGSMGGQSPITYSAISIYAADHGITGPDFKMLRTMIQALDAEWLKFQAEKREADNEQR